MSQPDNAKRKAWEMRVPHAERFMNTPLWNITGFNPGRKVVNSFRANGSLYKMDEIGGDRYTAVQYVSTPLRLEDLFHINDLLNKLLLLTRLKKEEAVGIKPHEIRLKTLFHSLQNLLDKQLKEKQITLTTQYPETMKTIVPREYLEMILSNLLSNSIKYSENKKNISIRIFENNLNTTIEVKDEGIGMTNEETRNMFDRFFRARTNRESGYGIGLSIVKQICDIFDVAIKVESQKNKGTKIALVFKKI